MCLERGGCGGVECAKRSCACSVGDSTEVFGIGGDGDGQGKECDQDVSEVSGFEEEAVLGESFLVERVLCEHGGIG